MIGKALGHYTISAKLGEGGMGEVYLAEDTTLGREVALKVLPADLAGSQQRLERFRREARTLAALDHPNIVHIYSVEEADGVHFLTMQLVRGQLLSDRIPARGLPLREFFAIAAPLSDALAAAHDKGITHRDLKPSNIMIDDDGRVKVLDFGLAKLHDPDTEIETSQLPTEAITEEGLVVGTVPYMSPEQAEGRSIDHRSDIFSLGIVLHQMATGRAPFRGETPLSVLSAILREDPPPVEQINDGLPRHLGRIVRKCLEKDPARRYQSTRDLHNDLVGLAQEVESGAVRPVGKESSSASSRPWWQGGLLALTALVVLAVLVWQLTGAPPQDTPRAVEWRTRRLTDLPGVQTEPSLSPDGRHFVFVEYATGERGRMGAGRSHIFTQRVGGDRPVNLTSDWEGLNCHPAYSPDGQMIAFRSDRDGGGIFVMGATGENPRKVVGEGFNPAWAPDGSSIVYSTVGVFDPRSAPMTAHELRVVDLASGSARTIGRGRQPAWSPSGERIAYFDVREGGWRDIATVAADGADASSGGPAWMTDDAYLDWSPVWSPDGGTLYFASTRGGAHNIWSIAIDQQTGQVTGEPFSVTRGGTEVQGFLSLSADGRSIVYAARQEISNIYRVGFDPERREVTGEIVPVTTGPRNLGLFDLSPDGRTIAAMVRSPQEDIVLMRADGSGERKLTDDPYNDRRPRFAPGGERIYFYSGRDGHSRIWSIRPDGTGLELITDRDGDFAFSDPSPDGTRMSTNRIDRSEIFSLTEPYSQQAPLELPRDQSGRRFAPLEWMADGSGVLGRLSGGTYAIYRLDSRGYEPLEGTASLQDLTPFGESLFLGRLDKELVLYDKASGEISALLSTAPDSLQGIRFAPDGRTIYFLRASATSDIHLLEVAD